MSNNLRADKRGAHRTEYAKNRKRILLSCNVCAICGKPVDKSLKFPHPMSALKDISNVSYSEYYHKAMLNMDLSKEVDFQHLVMIEIKKEGYIKYDRRRKK